MLHLLVRVYKRATPLKILLRIRLSTNTIDISRDYFGFYTSLSKATSWDVLENLTQYQKPCFYKEYVQIDSPKISLIAAPENFCVFSVWVTSPDTTVSTEVFLYHTEKFLKLRNNESGLQNTFFQQIKIHRSV